MKRFTGICLITSDVARLRSFYHSLLQLEGQGDDNFTSFDTLGAQLVLFDSRGMETMAPGAMRGAGYGSCTLEFEVADVDREYERLSALGVAVVKPPTTQPWGRRSVWLRDPDGNIINLFAMVGESLLQEGVSVRVRRYFERLLNEKDLSVCDELLSAGYVDHDAPPDTAPGPASIRDYAAWFLGEYPDLHVEVGEVIAGGNSAAAHLVWHAHQRETGEVFHQEGTILLRLDDEGKFAERWSVYA